MAAPYSPVLDESTAARGANREGRIPDGPLPALSIVWHPAAHRAGERLLLYGVALGRAIAVSRSEPDFAKQSSAIGEPLSDPFVSRKPLVFRAVPGGGVVLEVPAGARVVCAGKPAEGRIELDREAVTRGVPLALADRVVLLLHMAEPQRGPTGPTFDMAGESMGIRRVRAHIERVADVHVPVLIRGETGTGKELVARAIHSSSPRRTSPFVAVNLGAIPKELAAAELFGAQRGAFTGAMRDREGFFAAARGGTLFLDELGEAPPDVQAMLLRVLETGEMYPVGASAPVSADVRLIAATDANLEEQIQRGRFKAPLLHRLSGYEIRLPPLRERREDIGVLIHEFAREELALVGEGHRLKAVDMYADPWLPAHVAMRLVDHDWPGNIRQLRNVVRQIVIGSRGQPTATLDPQLEADLVRARPTPAPEPTPPAPPSVPQPISSATPQGPARRKPRAVTEQDLLAALQAQAWDLKATADQLGIPRPSIYDLIERHPGIRTAGDLSAGEIERVFHECEGDLDQMVPRLRVSRRALQRRLKELGLKGRRSSP